MKKVKSYNSKFKVSKTIFNFALIIATLYFELCTSNSLVFAVSPTATPKLTPSASPSASLTPTGVEEEKVQEIRQAIKDKLTQIKEKIEKKAYVGIILEITDSTLTLGSFRGKQRVRIMPETKIISDTKKETTIKDLAVEDKVISMGEVDASGTLEAKRIVKVAKPQNPPAKRITFFGTVTEINGKTATLTLTNIKNLDQTLLIKVDKNTDLTNPKDPKEVVKFNSLTLNQKILVIYFEPAEGKAPIAKTIFVLP